MMTRRTDTVRRVFVIMKGSELTREGGRRNNGYSKSVKKV